MTHLFVHRLSYVIVAALVSQLATFSIADQADYVPQRIEYPPHNSGVYLAGELVVVDPINRRGGIRLNGDGNHQRYLNGPLHYFAMLPCGEVWYNGAKIRYFRPNYHDQSHI